MGAEVGRSVRSDGQMVFRRSETLVVGMFFPHGHKQFWVRDFFCNIHPLNIYILMELFCKNVVRSSRFKCYILICAFHKSSFCIFLCMQMFPRRKYTLLLVTALTFVLRLFIIPRGYRPIIISPLSVTVSTLHWLRVSHIGRCVNSDGLRWRNASTKMSTGLMRMRVDDIRMRNIIGINR